MTTTDRYEIMTELMAQMGLSVTREELTAEAYRARTPAAISLHALLEELAGHLAAARDAARHVQQELQHVVDGTNDPTSGSAYLRRYWEEAHAVTTLRRPVDIARAAYEVTE